jgi:hypothetical protein
MKNSPVYIMTVVNVKNFVTFLTFFCLKIISIEIINPVKSKTNAKILMYGKRKTIAVLLSVNVLPIIALAD